MTDEMKKKHPDNATTDDEDDHTGQTEAHAASVDDDAVVTPRPRQRTSERYD